MRKLTKKFIREYITDCGAEDVTDKDFITVRELFKNEDVYEIGYHCGKYGQDAGLFQSRKTGKFYVILKRNTTLLANVI